MAKLLLDISQVADLDRARVARNLNVLGTSISAHHFKITLFSKVY